jgi:hypothetical protein
MAVGRISGPLLKDNLLRNGVNLAFETNLLYLDVVNSRVGINTATPTNDLSVNGTTRTTNLYASNSAQIGLITFSGSTVSSTDSTISFAPNGTNATVYQGTALVGNLSLTGNTVSSTNTNGAINITADGSGVINLNNNTLINGNLHVTGNITLDGAVNNGNIELGNQTTDTITFTGEVNSDILPSATNTYNLGSNALKWNNIYAQSVNATTFNANTLTAYNLNTSGLNINGNTISAISVNSDLNFSATGTGGVVLGNFRFYQNSITNVISNAVTTFSESGSGYVQFAGTYGVVIPVGTSSNRPALAYETTGMIRFNTDLNLVEVYNGIIWESVAGASIGVTSATAQDIGVETALALG